MTNVTKKNGGKENSGKTGVGRRTFLGAVGAGAATTALAGCIGGGGGGSGGNLVIGHLAPMDNPLGLGSDRSIDLAVEGINEDGGVLDNDVEYITGDTRADPSEGQRVTEELIQQDEVDVLIGTFASEVAQNIIDLAAENDVPFLVTGSASPVQTRDFAGEDYERYRNVFRPGPLNSDLQAEAIGGYCEYLNERHGWEDVAFLRDNASWTEPFAEILPEELPDRGVNIKMEDALSIETEDFAPVMSDVAEAQPDYVLRFFAHISAGQMLGIWHEAQYGFGVEGIHVSSMLPAYFAATEGVAAYETTSQTGAGGVTAITDRTLDFVGNYQQRYADESDPPIQAPMYMGFATFDATEIVTNVAEEIGTTDFSGNLDDFVDEMLEVDHTGVGGEIEFYGSDSDYPHDLVETRNDSGDIVNFPVTQWQPSDEEGPLANLECVYPEQYRTAEHIKPPWME